MSLENLNKQIQTTTDLKDIVGTMKILSSISIAPYTKALESLKEYAKNIQDAFKAYLINDGRLGNSAPLTENSSVLAVLIGSDNGLVGKFNKDVLNYAERFLQEKHIQAKQITYLCIGKRIGMITQSKVGTALDGTYAISNSIKEIASISSSILIRINKILSQKSISHVYVFHNHKESGEVQHPISLQLMPLPHERILELSEKKWESKSIPQIPEEKEQILSALIHEYLTVVLTHGLTASLAAEHYTRMVNMQQAEKNIEKSLEDMNLAYQQARQTEITDELIDIVSGAEAMTKTLQNRKKPTDDLTKAQKKDKTSTSFNKKKGKQND